jgi:hypothetical protein
MFRYALAALAYLVLAGMAWALGTNVVQLLLTPLWRAMQGGDF